MRRAIYGGSFNPIHNDHVRLALSFAKQFELDRVIIIPTRMTPLKDNSRIADGADRLNMCRLATESYDNLEVSDIEVFREGLSYTSDTIAQLKNDDDELFLIVGADMYVTLDKWHDFQYIFDNATILVAPRNELDYNSLVEKYEYYKKEYGCRTMIAQNGIGGLSSTKVRSGIASGEDVSGMVDPKVLDYIREHGLYL